MKPLYFSLLLALSMPACSHFTETGRRQHAYAKQTKKAEKQRKQHQKEVLKERQFAVKKIPPMPGVSEPVITTSVESSPGQ
jgi:hypothetical protein